MYGDSLIRVKWLPDTEDNRSVYDIALTPGRLSSKRDLTAASPQL